jgi:hypothetical protein
MALGDERGTHHGRIRGIGGLSDAMAERWRELLVSGYNGQKRFCMQAIAIYVGDLGGEKPGLAMVIGRRD